MHRYLQISAKFGAIALIILTLSLIAIEVNAQNQFTTDIAERLEQQGVPIIEVTMINRVPYEFEISLQSSSTNEHLSVDDNWFMQLARREANFAYLISTRLRSFKLVVYNAKGESIYSTQTYLYPEDLNQRANQGQPKVDNQKAKKIVANELQLDRLTLDRLDVDPDQATWSKGQILQIRVSSDNLESANESLPIFLGSLFRILEIGDDEFGTYFVLCHLVVVDRNNNILLDYVRDVEAGTTQWTSVQGLYNDWFPHPSESDVATNQLIPVPTTENYPPTPTPESFAPLESTPPSNPYP